MFGFMVLLWAFRRILQQETESCFYVNCSTWFSGKNLSKFSGKRVKDQNNNNNNNSTKHKMKDKMQPDPKSSNRGHSLTTTSNFHPVCPTGPQVRVGWDSVGGEYTTGARQPGQLTWTDWKAAPWPHWPTFTTGSGRQQAHFRALSREALGYCSAPSPQTST